MAHTNDRVGDLLEGIRHNRKVIVSPEGVPLDIRIASHGERVTAFALDITFMTLVIVCLYILLVFLLFSDSNFMVGLTLILFLAFLVRNLYFIHFELAWQGRTPGKRICGLRVINRSGGELTPSAVIARNLTREVEFFLPLSLLVGVGVGHGFWQNFMLLGWVLAITLLPYFNRDHLRAGDLIGGTQVIAMPKRVLLDDLSSLPAEGTPRAYVFTPEQLAIYGMFELQVLEEFLRRPDNSTTRQKLAEVCEKICHKIGWQDAVPSAETRRFLTDFYAAERANLERGQLFGQVKVDKLSLPTSAGESSFLGNAAHRVYAFSADQLAVYGAYEMRVLEDLLRRTDTNISQPLLEEVCGKIRRKIHWPDVIPPEQVRRFLTDFYTAKRAKLEREHLLGQAKGT